jgi:hypothetical protein
MNLTFGIVDIARLCALGGQLYENLCYSGVELLTYAYLSPGNGQCMHDYAR